MKRKDDRLLRLAFGELTDDAARAVEANATAAERAEVESFRALREGLQQLPPPPPDNLSAERLRAAILDRELKGRPARPTWGGLLLAPVALAAMAAVVVLPRLRSRPEPQIVATATPALELKAPAFDFRPTTELPVARAASAPKIVAAAPAKEPERVAVRRSRRHRPAVEPVEQPDGALENAVVSVPVVTHEDPEARVAALASIKPEPQAIAAPPSAVVEAAPGTEGRTETVVVVSAQRDVETGAPAATEKEAASVLVGG